MSGPFHAIAKLMEERLEGREALAGVPVVLDQQKDVRAEVEIGVAKETGAAITILYEGGTVENPQDSGPRVAARYTVRAWGLPVMRETSESWVPTETVHAEIMRALHHWVPVGHHPAREMRVSDPDLEPDNDYLVYTCTATVTVDL